MIDKEKRLKKAEYMREYRKKNKEKVNAQARERRLENLEHYKELGRIRNRRYLENHKDEINERRKEKNWYFTPEKAKARRDKYQKDHPDRISIRSAKSRAKKANLPFDLTIEWFNKEFEKGCAMTGLPLDPNGSKTSRTVHIDRIIPEKGYVMNNCRTVCACYNLAKKNWMDGDVLIMAEALVKHKYYRGN